MKKHLKRALEKKNLPIIFIVLLASVGVGYLIISTLSRISTLEDSLTALKDMHTERIDTLEQEMAVVYKNNEDLAQELQVERNRGVANAVRLGQIGSTVGTLEKITQTDDELLKKYSKTYFLNEHYVPLSLATIPQEYLDEGDIGLQIHSSVSPYLNNLLNQAKNDGISLKITSAYRSFGEQAVLKSSYRFLYGAGTANQFSAEQGYSEHQLGTTVDFVSEQNGSTLGGFDGTNAYQWLLTNAHKYGFVLSYPQNNSYYEFEPWHWRFVGVALATKLHNEGKQFYDTDQRVIDSFLANLFE